MAILIRLLVVIIIFAGIYYIVKNSAKKETEDNIEDFKQRNEINKLKNELEIEKSDHREEVEYLNETINKLKEQLAEAKIKNEDID